MPCNAADEVGCPGLTRRTTTRTCGPNCAVARRSPENGCSAPVTTRTMLVAGARVTSRAVRSGRLAVDGSTRENPSRVRATPTRSIA